MKVLALPPITQSSAQPLPCHYSKAARLAIPTNSMYLKKSNGNRKKACGLVALVKFLFSLSISL